MSTALKELEILKSRNIKYPECQNPDLYRILYKQDIFVLAYDNLKYKEEKIKGIENTIQDLKSQKFKFSNHINVIQEAIRLILDAIFQDNGFRVYQIALKEIKNKWRGSKWFIRGKFSNQIDPHVLIELLRQKIKDEKFIHLIWKFLRSEYTVDGILFPLLSNIYFNELDKFLMIISHKHDIGRWKVSPVYIRIRYVRYANEWIIGIIGSKSLAEIIRSDVETFLLKKLKIQLNLDLKYAKTKVTPFLGIEIIIRNTFEIQLNVNMLGVIKRLKHVGICDGKGFPICRKSHINYEDWEIIISHNRILSRISNDYRFVNNRNKLARVQYIIHYSAAKTLAGKHKKSLSQIFKSYGKNLIVKYGKDKTVSLINEDWTKGKME